MFVIAMHYNPERGKTPFMPIMPNSCWSEGSRATVLAHDPEAASWSWRSGDEDLWSAAMKTAERRDLYAGLSGMP
jgi:hypothetical protein